jgi:hypothetical protein
VFICGCSACCRNTSSRDRLGSATHAGRGWHEHLGRQRVHVAADAFEHIGDAVDERLEQPREHGDRTGALRRMPRGVGDIATERQRVGVAVGDERVARQDEGDLTALGPVGVDPGDDGGRHVEHARLLVEAVRGLDLAHLLAGRHIDAELRFDALLFVGGGLEQIDPERVGRQRRPRGVCDAVQARVVEQETADHTN